MSNNRILADERSRHFEQMIADMTIKPDPIPIGGDIYLPDIISLTDRLVVEEDLSTRFYIDSDGAVIAYKAVPNNLLLNPKFQSDLFAWTINQSSSHRESNSIFWDASQIDVDRHLTTSVGSNLSGVEDGTIESTIFQVVPVDSSHTFFLEAWGKIINEEGRPFVGTVELKCRVTFLSNLGVSVGTTYETTVISSVEDDFIRIHLDEDDDTDVPTGAVFARVEIVFSTSGVNSTINAHIMNIRFVTAPRMGEISDGNINSLLNWSERAIVGRHSAN